MRKIGIPLKTPVYNINTLHGLFFVMNMTVGVQKILRQCDIQNRKILCGQASLTLICYSHRRQNSSYPNLHTPYYCTFLWVPRAVRQEGNNFKRSVGVQELEFAKIMFYMSL